MFSRVSLKRRYTLGYRVLTQGNRERQIEDMDKEEVRERGYRSL